MELLLKLYFHNIKLAKHLSVQDIYIQNWNAGFVEGGSAMNVVI